MVKRMEELLNRRDVREVDIGAGVTMYAYGNDPTLKHPSEVWLDDVDLPRLRLDVAMPRVRPPRLPPGPAWRRD